ncbi:dipeptide/oligopeptide/nickel ABC transporter ATP-binding protein [Microbacterium faecale]|uniref:Dipeptide/oligopeptide/nickel ABC transporter ATP-binding protein n=1 Tax=Microbacterium faecale TaxID=1804630 RepID=A0A916XZV3_9MICO|nr:dipeptide/oligopeptide/nickel ABC transporter permease/ATP-binding protein [Microbacterium faecale]GGD24725.1 dipeptide/oligopeptide/nickel ABC transporter ATP-binding protein [Microbacterium faecale]
MTQAPILPTTSITAVGAGRTRKLAFLRHVRRAPLAAAGVVWLIILAVASFSAPFLPLKDPLKQNLSAALQGPSAEYLLGTDALGRDVFSRILWGGQGALLGSLEAVVVAIVLGVTVGVVAGYYGGWLNGVANRIAELVFALPAMVVLLALAAVFGTSIVASMAAFGVLVSASYLRMAQASTLAVRSELYVDAAKVAGLSTPRVVFGHVLPNVVGPIIVMSSLTFGAALLVQASLGFLGLGPPPPAPTWGGMIAEASTYIYQHPWLLVPTGVVLALTILAANLIGDALRDGDGKRQRFSLLTRAANTAPTLPARTDAAQSERLLEVRDLSITFSPDDSGEKVVDGISFGIDRGEIVAVVGESGSGKTMTALAIIGLLPVPGHVCEGAIEFDGVGISSLSPSKMATYRGKRIGMISQEPMMALDPCFTVASQLVAPVRRHRKVGRAEGRRIARSLLEEVGLRDIDAVMHSYPHQLSGGMAQRVAIAIALTGEPELLIADEPTTALDVTVQAGILDLLRSLQKKTGMAIMFVTHDLGVVADIASRAVVMEKGHIVEKATVEGLFADPQHEYTRALIGATPSLVDVGGPHV